MSGTLFNAHQVRKLEFLLGEAVESGCDTVLTCGALQSNFCRAAAVAAQEVGLKSYLFLKMKDKLVRENACHFPAALKLCVWGSECVGEVCACVGACVCICVVWHRTPPKWVARAIFFWIVFVGPPLWPYLTYATKEGKKMASIQRGLRTR